MSLGDTEPLQSTFQGKDDRAPPTSFTIATSTFVSNPSPPLLSYRVIFLLSLSLVLGQCTGPQSTAPSWTTPPPRHSKVFYTSLSMQTARTACQGYDTSLTATVLCVRVGPASDPRAPFSQLLRGCLVVRVPDSAWPRASSRGQCE